MMMTECKKTQLWFLRGLSVSEVGLKIPDSARLAIDILSQSAWQHGTALLLAAMLLVLP